MKIIISLMLFLCYISAAFAHPNHMSFANDNQAMSMNSEQLTRDINKEKNDHHDIAPCTEQHEQESCKK